MKTSLRDYDPDDEFLTPYVEKLKETSSYKKKILILLEIFPSDFQGIDRDTLEKVGPGVDLKFPIDAEIKIRRQLFKWLSDVTGKKKSSIERGFALFLKRKLNFVNKRIYNTEWVTYGTIGWEKGEEASKWSAGLGLDADGSIAEAFGDKDIDTAIRMDMNRIDSEEECSLEEKEARCDDILDLSSVWASGLHSVRRLLRLNLGNMFSRLLAESKHEETVAESSPQSPAREENAKETLSDEFALNPDMDTFSGSDNLFDLDDADLPDHLMIENERKLDFEFDETLKSFDPLL